MNIDIKYILNNILPNIIIQGTRGFVPFKVENSIFELFESKFYNFLKVNWVIDAYGKVCKVSHKNKFSFTNNNFKKYFNNVKKSCFSKSNYYHHISDILDSQIANNEQNIQPSNNKLNTQPQNNKLNSQISNSEQNTQSSLKEQNLSNAGDRHQSCNSPDQYENFYNNEIIKLIQFYEKIFPYYQLNFLRFLQLFPQILDKNILTFKISKQDNGLISQSIIDTFELIENVMKLYNYKKVLPEIQIIYENNNNPIFFEVMKTYFNNENYFNDFKDKNLYHQHSFRPVKIEHIVKNNEITNVDITISNDITYKHNKINFIAIEKLIKKTKYYSEKNLQIIYPKVSNIKFVEYFLIRLFGHQNFRFGQEEIILKVLRGENSLAILPTGYGKSLCFQLPAMLIPGMAIIIVPLKSLMIDQVFSLKKSGFQNVAYISSQQTSNEKNDILARVEKNQIKILYISPERLQQKDFIHKLEKFLTNGVINYFVIDEAHCISEWGHDFRLSYLNLKNIINYFVNKNNEIFIPVIALTATASQIVKKDIVKVLAIDDKDIMPPRMLNRPEISFEVVKYDNSEKVSDVIYNYLANKLPDILKLNLMEKHQNGFEKSGIIFSIYADPLGKTTQDFGCISQIKKIYKELNDKKIARFYMSKVPLLCPVHSYTVDILKNYYKCSSCGKIYTNNISICNECDNDKIVFEQNKFYCSECDKEYNFNENLFDNNEWEYEKLKIQNDFLENKFPVLIATKGYGMGIDKPNIRYVIHNAMPISIEGYYQEAGRAGRDKERAHSVIFYSPPHYDCLTNEIESPVTRSRYRPKCMEGKYYKYKECFYGLSNWCDYAKQFSFIDSNFERRNNNKYLKNKILLSLYKSIAFIRDYKDVDNLIVLYDKYIRKKKSRILFSGKNKNQIEKYVYRFEQLGFIKKYYITYSQNGGYFELYYNENISENIMLQNFLNIKKYITLVNDIEEENRIKKKYYSYESYNDKVYILLCWLTIINFENFVFQRIRMLQNINFYCSIAKGEKCRRYFLIKYFVDNPAVDSDDEQCELCDGCRGDLSFETDKSKPFKFELTSKDLNDLIGEKVAETKRVESLKIYDITNKNILEFDLHQLADLVGQVINARMINSVIVFCRKYLESYHNNWACLFLNGILSVVSNRTLYGLNRLNELYLMMLNSNKIFLSAELLTIIYDYDKNYAHQLFFENEKIYKKHLSKEELYYINIKLEVIKEKVKQITEKVNNLLPLFYDILKYK